MNEAMIVRLSAQVQHNCHISDARHGADYAICTFLMKMREYYRWEKHIPHGQHLPKDDVAGWLAAREQLWEDLVEEPYQPLLVSGRRFDAFDSVGINNLLQPLGLVYSAGLGRGAKPHFFLGQLERRSQQDACLVLVSNREYARDLSAPAAMNLDDTIFLRRESLRQMLWEKLESWRWNRPDNALGRAFACYDFEHAFDSSLEAMTEVEMAAVLLHESGEYRAGKLLGAQWDEMLTVLFGTPAERLARAVRDHLADCLVTLPALAQSGAAASLHFYLGNLTPMRKALFPALQQAYEQWRATTATEPLRQLAEQGAAHWRRLAQRLLARYSAGHRQTLVDDVTRWVDGAHL